VSRPRAGRGRTAGRPSERQSCGVLQVGTAIAQIDRTTQQNGALVEQSATAARSLKDRAECLAQAVAVFKVHH